MTIPSTFYLVTTDYARLGFGSAGDATTVFDDAVDQYVECRNDEQPAVVWQCQPMTGDLLNVTEQAFDRAQQWWGENGAQIPDWAIDEMQQPLAAQ